MLRYVLFAILVASCSSATEEEVEQPLEQVHTIFTDKYDHIPKQYSYRLLCYVGNSVRGQATCFFIKNCNKVFLVTNYHVVSGVNTHDGIIPEIRPDSAIVELTPGGDTIHVNFQEIKKSPRAVTLYETPDIAAIDITEQVINNTPIQLINNVVIKDYRRLQEGQQYYAVGYPLTQSEPYTLLFRDLRSEHKVITFMLKGKMQQKTHTFVLGDTTTSGMSGSPVFKIYHDSSTGKQVLAFAGVVTSHDVNNTYVVKNVTVFSLLDSLCKSGN